MAREEALVKMQEVRQVDAAQATRVLWETYHPYRLWFLLAALGIASAVGIFFYSRCARKYEAADV